MTTQSSSVVTKIARSVPGLLTQTDAIVAGVGNPNNAQWFGAPNASSPSLATIVAARQAVAAAQTPALARTKCAAELRNARATTLRGLLMLLAAWVASIAAANPAESAAIIQAAGFSPRQAKKHDKAALAIKQGSASGTVLAVAKAARNGVRAFYDWRYSTNGGASWIQVQGTNVARTVIGGLPALATASFQVRVTMKNVPGEWSQVVTFFVH
jgi:hypothetical protein